MKANTAASFEKRQKGIFQRTASHEPSSLFRRNQAKGTEKHVSDTVGDDLQNYRSKEGTDNSMTEVIEYLYSELSDDPELLEIVEMFVDEMPERTKSLAAHYEAEDWKALQTHAHQLKGAAGSYGFGQITAYAATLEDAIKSDRPESEIRAAYEVLFDACRRVRLSPA